MPATITLISHASVVIQIAGVRVLTDPWQTGTAFNNSWRLLVEPVDLAPILDDIDYLWISHEHPDHFHIPTLKALPLSFRERVQVLFQSSSDADKMVGALNGPLGFKNVRLMQHRAFVPLANGVEAYCYHSRQIDSALALRGAGTTILNLNDVEASARDLALLRADLGPIDVMLNQFSIAGYSGIDEALPALAATILDNMARDHRALDARATMPFAGFAYFCCEDNRHINAHANSPRSVADRFAREDLQLVVLAPGDRWEVGASWSNAAAFNHYDALYSGLGAREFRADAPVAVPELAAAFGRQRAKLRDMHGRLPLAILRPFTVRIPDLDRTLRFGFASGTAEEAPEAAPDLTINSQPLHFLFSQPFGLQTLGVSGRYRLHAGKRNWLAHRVLMAAMNAGVGLAPDRMLSRAQLGWLWRRREGFVEQITNRLRHAYAS